MNLLKIEVNLISIQSVASLLILLSRYNLKSYCCFHSEPKSIPCAQLTLPFRLTSVHFKTNHRKWLGNVEDIKKILQHCLRNKMRPHWLCFLIGHLKERFWSFCENISQLLNTNVLQNTRWFFVITKCDIWHSKMPFDKGSFSSCKQTIFPPTVLG